jgi:plastocyanin
MSRRTHARVGLALAVALIAAAVAVPAFAAVAPRHVTETTTGGAKFVPNRMFADTMHFKLGTIRIRSGGTLTFVDKTKAPHTFSVVKKRQVPRTANQANNCFGPGPCDEIARAHGAVNPETGEEQTRRSRSSTPARPASTSPATRSFCRPPLAGQRRRRTRARPA